MSKGKISIGRWTSNDPKRTNTIYIQVENSSYKRVCDIELTPENFAKALTGFACAECDILERDN